MGLLDKVKNVINKKSQNIANTQDTDILVEELSAQIKEKSELREAITEKADLTPEIHNGKKRSYHYKDVNIWVVWQYGGQYGKSLGSIGVGRGDDLCLKPVTHSDDDDFNVEVYWNDLLIGHMKKNRLAGMVSDWQKADLPVLAKVAHVGGEEKLYMELSFYGKPKTSKKADNNK